MRLALPLVMLMVGACSSEPTEAERQDYERRIVLAQRILMVVIVPAFAGLGYWLGRSLSGWGI